MQASIIAEANLRANQDPRWRMLMAIPNGQYRKGQRMEPGLRPGVPDLFLPVPRARGGEQPPFHGLFIELKMPGKHPSAQQEKWLQALDEQGYCTFVTSSAEKAIEALQWYLRGGKDTIDLEDAE